MLFQTLLPLKSFKEKSFFNKLLSDSPGYCFVGENCSLGLPD